MCDYTKSSRTAFQPVYETDNNSEGIHNKGRITDAEKTVMNTNVEHSQWTVNSGGDDVVVKRLWKRYVTGQPDAYQAYISLPTDVDGPPMTDVHDVIESLEIVVEGRLDIYARVRRLAIVSDRISTDGIDTTEFDAVLERLEELYAETHSVAQIEKWRSINGQFVKTYVVVPVKPLFPDADGRPRGRHRSAVEQGDP